MHNELRLSGKLEVSSVPSADIRHWHTVRLVFEWTGHPLEAGISLMQRSELSMANFGNR